MIAVPTSPPSPSGPTPEEMYAAIVRRDATLAGVFVVGVKTTGVFCRPGCGARTPLRRNVEFFPTVSAALHAGYRPCKRCRPLEAGERAPAWVAEVLELAMSHPGRRLTARDLRAHGLDPARAARYFKRRYGMTFQAYHRALRVGAALSKIRSGATMTSAQVRSGFESSSGLREAFHEYFGAAPTRVQPGVSPVRVTVMTTPLGDMLAGATDAGVCLLEFTDRRGLATQIATLRRRFATPIVPGESTHLAALRAQLEAYFAGARRSFDLPLDAPGTPFQQSVWDALRQIPPDETRSYAAIARAIGRPTAVRAVARANGDNRIAILIPCHRVIGSDGSAVGYAGQIWRKQWLLNHEQQLTGKSEPLFPGH